MAEQKNIHYDPEGERIVNRQITEAYQSGVIDRVLEEHQSGKQGESVRDR